MLKKNKLQNGNKIPLIISNFLTQIKIAYNINHVITTVYYTINNRIY